MHCLMDLHINKYLVFYLMMTVTAYRVCGQQICQETTPKTDNGTIMYTCTGATDLTQIYSNLPSDVEEVVMQDCVFRDIEYSNYNSSVEFKFLQALVVKNCFFENGFIEWISGLDTLMHICIINSSSDRAIRHNKSDISVLNLELPVMKNLLSLNISGSYIASLSVGNNTHMPDLLLSNNYFDCMHDFVWLLHLYEKSSPKVELTETLCYITLILGEDVAHQMPYTLDRKPFFPVMDYVREAKENCPPLCFCELKGMVTINRPQLNIDCIGLNMTKLPRVIPKGSSRFNLSHNAIHDLSPLYSNSLYSTVAMFEFAYNNISFLDPIKFSNFVQKGGDRGISLAHNKLTKFPAREIKIVYEEAYIHKRFRPPRLTLGHNPYICSCDYVGDFQNLLYQQTYDIEDTREIRCSENDPYNPGQMVLSLDVVSMCSKEPLLETLDIINILLVLLLLLLVTDFAYNYHQYRKNRRLPWIVSKFKC